MKRLFPILILLSGVMALTMIGCSDDDEVTTPTEKEVGSLNDPQFQQVVSAIEIAEGFTGEMIDDLLDQIGRIDIASRSPKLAGSALASVDTPADVFELDYDTLTQYWHIHLIVTDTTDSVTFTYTDSLQLRNDDGPMHWPDTTINEVRSGMSVVAQGIGNSDQIAASQNWVISGDLHNQGVVTVDGGGTLSVDITETEDARTCEIDLAFTATYDSVVVDLSDDDACPTAGTVRHDGSVSLSCTDGTNTVTLADTWMARVTFIGTNVSAIWENSRYRWTYAGPCDELP